MSNISCCIASGVSRGAGLAGSGTPRNWNMMGSASWQLRVGQEHLPGDLLARQVVAVVLGDTEGVPVELHPREQRDRLPVRHAMSRNDADAPGAATLAELVAEPALADARLADEADDLPLAGERALEALLEHRHLSCPSDETREAAHPGDVEPRAELATALELEETERLAQPLHVRRSEIAEAQVSPDELRGVLGQERPPRLGELLHPLRQPDRVPEGRVVHAQIVADPAHDDLSRVEADADGEVEAARGAQPVRVAPDLVAEIQRRPARALRVVLVGDRRAEERHDAVAGELVDGALEAVDALGEEAEEAVEDRVPLLPRRRARRDPSSPSRRRRAPSPACARPRARCACGVCARRGGRACRAVPALAVADVASAVPQALQKREPGGFDCPQAVHCIGEDA
jgi:hypothetical protein